MSGLSVGSIVRCRNREWVIVPSPDEELLLLRPLTGSESEICGIYRKLSNLGHDRVEPATFPLPSPQDTSDAVATELLFNASRLTLRDGAGPFRSLGRVSVRPRPYQFVPLLMALRLQAIRLLIADDVGVGKTIEALLIARELLDRGEIHRLCVLCPPYLCDQWKKELSEKFQINAVVIRSGTVGPLERNLPAGDHSVFRYYTHSIVSIDYAKSDRHRANFIQNCAELVIVDEAHGAALPSGHARAQQQRHELLRDIAKEANRHLILLSATPHSGVEESFLSLLSLLKSRFKNVNLKALKESDRDELALHFIQRKRVDVEHWLGEDTPFPKREPKEETYDLSAPYRELFNGIYEFSRELVHTGEALKGWKKRIRYWTALALLRCVMSSPAAALAALQKREKGILAGEDTSDENYAPYIYEPTDDEPIDVLPSHIVQEGETDLAQSDQRKLRSFSALAEKLKSSESDRKIIKCAEIVKGLLRDGFHPIVWCRYIATSDYISDELKSRLQKEFKDLRVMSITGTLSEEERRERIEELSEFKRRILVATDCLSEGINLQGEFNAVVHYDLPWNPNRLEQREGRVDRFGQKKEKVKAVLLYGRDNPVDGAVLDVLLRKAKHIYNALGVSVPVPQDSETVMEAVLKTLFFKTPHGQQMALFEEPLVQDVHKKWDEAASREKENRTRFAQRAIKPDDVMRELKETDAVLGDADAVRNFLENACQRFDVSFRSLRDGIFALRSFDRFPQMIKECIPCKKEEWKICFTSPNPEDTSYIGRNHSFVSRLAQFLLEEALTNGSKARAARGGVIRTAAVDRRTVIFLLRLRFTIEGKTHKPLLSEEVFVCGFQGTPPAKAQWLAQEKALEYLHIAKPDANISQKEREEVLKEVLGHWEALETDIHSHVEARSKKLEDAHRRVRSAAHLSLRGIAVCPHVPPDLIGALVLLPVPKGIKR